MTKGRPRDLLSCTKILGLDYLSCTPIEKHSWVSSRKIISRTFCGPIFN